MKFLTLACCLVTGAAVLSTSAAATVPPALEATFQTLPLKMQGSGMVLGDPTVLGGADFEASGTASHLGSWTNEGVLEIDPATGAATGSVVFTAANGDHLNGVFEGTFDSATGIAVAVFEWTGGTGRFAAASGSAGFVVYQDPTGSFLFEANGTLDI